MKPSFRITLFVALVSGLLLWMLAATRKPQTPEPITTASPSLLPPMVGVSTPKTQAATGAVEPIVGKPAVTAEAPSVTKALWLLKQKQAPRIPEEREQLMVGIEKMGTAEAAELLQLIPTVEDPELRDIAIFAFQRVATPENAQTLIDQVDHAADPADKAMALRLLAGIRQPDALAAMKNVVSDPQTPVTDPVLLASSRAISQSGHPEGIRTILARLDSEPMGSKRDVLLTELMQVSAPEAEAVLLDAASPSGGLNTSYARAAALYALRHTRDPETQQRLKDYAQDADQALAQAANEALAWNLRNRQPLAAESSGKE